MYQNIKVKPIDLLEGKISIENKYSFIDLNSIQGNWELKANGKILQKGTIKDLNLNPGEKKAFKIDLQKPKLENGIEYWLMISFNLKNKTNWAEKNHVLAWDQYKVPYKKNEKNAIDISKIPEVKYKQNKEDITVFGEAFSVLIGSKTGLIKSIIHNEKQLITRPLIPNFWRVPTDNDRGNKMEKRLAVWKTASANRLVTEIKIHKVNKSSIQIFVKSKINSLDAKYETTYTIYGSGDIIVDNKFIPGSKKLPEMPKFGMQMEMPKDFNQMKWYGRGPHETYWDRKTSGVIDVYSGLVEELDFNYIRPQENGNKTDVRWMTLQNSDGVGLLFSGMPLLSVSAWPCTQYDLENANHPFEIPNRNTITVNLDYKQMGVGGDNSWGAKTHDKYILPAREYEYSFRIKPFVSLDSIDELTKKLPIK